jgi:hypothetical protein
MRSAHLRIRVRTKGNSPNHGNVVTFPQQISYSIRIELSVWIAWHGKFLLFRTEEMPESYHKRVDSVHKWKRRYSVPKPAEIRSYQTSSHPEFHPQDDQCFKLHR